MWLIFAFIHCIFQVRGPDSLWHPDMLKIRKTIERVLLWPSMDGDEGKLGSV